MYIPEKRDDTQGKKNQKFIICAVSIVFGVAIIASVYFLFRHLRQRYYEPKYLPGQYLKKKWKKWTPRNASYGQVPSPAGNGDARDTSYRGATPEMQTNDTVRRETSIRSIMTLPPYSTSPKPTEQIVAREGERGGMDMVVEYPETMEEEETRREQHMDWLYQLRLQRRQQLAEREARRRERREAREIGDTTRLQRLNAETQERAERRRTQRNDAASVTAAFNELQSQERNRRISTVSYAEIGHVRHDGSRLRADSHNSENNDSDRRPLLQNDDSSGAPSFEPSSFNSRIQSLASSIRSESTATELDPLAPSTTRGSSRPASHNDEGDLGTLNIPPPPDYDQLDWGDAPAYQSPVLEQTERNHQLPEINRLPSIRVNLPTSVSDSPVTPTQSRFQNSQDDAPTPTGIRIVSASSATTTSGHPTQSDPTHSP